MRRSMVVCAVGTALLTLTASAAVASGPGGHPVHGSSGIGDPYFPDAGNGGYDVRHYSLDLDYQTTSKHLSGQATITATATQNLSRFDLDLRPDMTVSAVQVNGSPARIARSGQELVLTPNKSLHSGAPFVVKVRYGGTPAPVTDPDGSPDGWIPTDDGAFLAGEPQGRRVGFRRTTILWTRRPSPSR